MYSLNKASKKKPLSRKHIRRNYFFEQLKPKLKEIFDSVNRTGTTTISILEIQSALQLLNVNTPTQKIENLEEIFTNSKDILTRSDITFDDFANLCFHFIDSLDIHQSLRDFPVFDFLDPSLFVLVSDNNIIMKNFSTKFLDESIILRERVEHKYGINEKHNVKILNSLESIVTKTFPNSPDLEAFRKYSKSLGNCWEWIGKCLEQRKTSKDFTQGLRNIFPGLFQSQNLVHAEKIVMESYIVSTNAERSEAINLLGWSYVDYFPKISNPKVNEIVKNIEKEQHYSRAAALCVFHFDFARAFQCLANVQTSNNEVSFLKSILQLLKDWQSNLIQEREILQIMLCDTSRNHEEIDEKNNSVEDLSNEILSLRPKPQPQKYEAFKKEIKFIKALCQHLNPSDPYFRAICKFISNSEHLSHIIKDHDLSFIDRLAFALRFLGPKALQNYLHETIEEAKEKGYLEALFLVGKSTEAFEIIQSYIDRTGDIQSVALLGVYFRLFRFPNEEFYKGLLTDYKDLLTKLGYWEERIHLEKSVMGIEMSFADSIKDRKATEQTQENQSYAASQRCYFCNSSLAHPALLSQLMENKKSLSQLHNYEKTRINFCPSCLKPLPNCAICLLPVSVLNPYIEFQERIKKVPSKRVTIDPEEALIWCQQCKHGGHYGHITEWFQNHTKCPVSGCLCECIQIDY